MALTACLRAALSGLELRYFTRLCSSSQDHDTGSLLPQAIDQYRGFSVSPVQADCVWANGVATRAKKNSTWPLTECSNDPFRIQLYWAGMMFCFGRVRCSRLFGTFLSPSLLSLRPLPFRILGLSTLKAVQVAAIIEHGTLTPSITRQLLGTKT